MDLDRPDLLDDALLDVPELDDDLPLDDGGDVPPADGDGPPKVPDDALRYGGRPHRRGRGDEPLQRSPYWMIPLAVSVVIGLERIAMLGTAPGQPVVPVIVFGALFVVTFAAVLIGGALMIERYRR